MKTDRDFGNEIDSLFTWLRFAVYIKINGKQISYNVTWLQTDHDVTACTKFFYSAYQCNLWLYLIISYLL